MVSKRLFVFAGEKSGDLHGSYLIKVLKKENPSIQIIGVAGPLMREQGVETILPMEDFELMGFTEILKALPKIFKQFKIVTKAIFENRIDTVLLIDYPGFNLRLAKKLRALGFQGKILQYISPTFWAWKPSRKEKMIETLDHLFTIYPFEEAHFVNTSLKTTYVGHPVFDTVRSHRYDPNWMKKLNIDESIPIISVFPGSRKSEIEKNLPLQLEALSHLKDEKVQIGVSTIEGFEYKTSLKNVVFVPQVYTYELMKASRASLAKSGTVTLELALHNCPTVVCYEMSFINRWIAEHVFKIKLPFYATANIVLNEKVFPELIEEKPTAKKLFETFYPLYQETIERKTCLKNLLRVSYLFSQEPTCEKLAKILNRDYL
jgi:lipid-A-disaccharide synthase